jgi:hypothetical protein
MSIFLRFYDIWAPLVPRKRSGLSRLQLDFTWASTRLHVNYKRPPATLYLTILQNMIEAEIKQG